MQGTPDHGAPAARRRPRVESHRETAAIHQELTAHAAELNTAADTYRRTDEALGGRVGQVMGTTVDTWSRAANRSTASSPSPRARETNSTAWGCRDVTTRATVGSTEEITLD